MAPVQLEGLGCAELRVDGRVNGLYRHLFQHSVEGEERRWMCESVNCGVKRVSGDSVRSRRKNTLFAEAALKV